ncbi:MAG: glyoxylate/hydroxypyruvate reductase A [Pseudomonadota bacterium]
MSLVFYSQVDNADDWRSALKAADPALAFHAWPDCGPFDEVEAVLAWKAPPGFYRQFPNLKLIINLGAGVDNIVRDATLPPGIPITRISDPEMGRMMSQFLLTCVMRHFREFGTFERARAERRWAYVHPRETRECTVGMMGLGQLGAIAAAEFVRQGFRVLGWSRSPKQLPGVETFAGLDALPAFLARSEICVMLLPLTPETENLMTTERFAQLPRGAKFVSAGRGRTVDEAALVEAIRSGHLAEATLDVFHEEPLPPSHPLWDLPQVLVTPHLASIAIPRTAAAQIVENLRRITGGEGPLNAVEPARGY